MLDILEKYYNLGLLYKQTHPTLDLTIWNYSPKVQYEGLWDDITMQCRGLVTNSKGEIVARPFKKFFNIEEEKHTPTEEFEVFEKMDGSLGIVFKYNGEVIYTTRGSFTSDQSKWMTKYGNEYNFKDILVEGFTYLFEIIYPENRIVVDYNGEEKLVLLGIINTETGEEVPHNDLFEGFDVVKKYNGIKDYTTLKFLIDNNAEGFVVRFSNGDRMKIKGEEYLRLHKIITNISNRDIWEYLKDGKPLDEILDKVPDEFHDWVKQTKEELLTQFQTLDEEYQWIFKIINRAPGIKNRPVFAEYAKRYKHPNILFNMLDGKDYSQQIFKLLYPTYSKPFKRDE